MTVELQELHFELISYTASSPDLAHSDYLPLQKPQKKKQHQKEIWC